MKFTIEKNGKAGVVEVKRYSNGRLESVDLRADNFEIACELLDRACEEETEREREKRDRKAQRGTIC